MLGFPRHFLHVELDGPTQLLKEGAPEGVRNDETYVAAHDLFRCGYTLEEATDKLVTALVALDFAEREIVRTIESAWAKHERELQP